MIGVKVAVWISLILGWAVLGAILFEAVTRWWDL
mgnify:CR=1 FL=1